MRRSLKVLITLLLVAVSATGVHAAQTDCQRWWKEYREALAHTPAVHRIRHVRHRVHHAARKQLALLVRPHVHPAPRVLPARHRPRPTRKEMLHALDFACGELPETEDAELLDLVHPGDLFAEVSLPETPVDTLPAGLGTIAESTPPQFPVTGVPPPSGIDLPPAFGPIFGPIGGGSSLPPNVPSMPGTPTGPTAPGTPGAPTVPESPVPEPGSMALVLTGAIGAAGMIRRRLR